MLFGSDQCLPLAHSRPAQGPIQACSFEGACFVLSLYLAAILSTGEHVDEMCLRKLFNSIQELKLDFNNIQNHVATSEISVWILEDLCLGLVAFVLFKW